MSRFFLSQCALMFTTSAAVSVATSCYQNATQDSIRQEIADALAASDQWGALECGEITLPDCDHDNARAVDKSSVSTELIEPHLFWVSYYLMPSLYHPDSIKLVSGSGEHDDLIFDSRVVNGTYVQFVDSRQLVVAIRERIDVSSGTAIPSLRALVRKFVRTSNLGDTKRFATHRDQVSLLAWRPIGSREGIVEYALVDTATKGPVAREVAELRRNRVWSNGTTTIVSITKLRSPQAPSRGPILSTIVGGIPCDDERSFTRFAGQGPNIELRKEVLSTFTWLADTIEARLKQPGLMGRGRSGW